MNDFRHEDKYLLNIGAYQMLRTRLQTVMEPDENVGRDNRYFVRSVYFDDCHDGGLQDKIEGVETREKYRVRMYDMHDDLIRLESKQKWGQLTRKTDVLLTRRQAEQLLRGDTWFLYDLSPDNPLPRQFYLKYRTRLLRPRVIVDYYREAYTYLDVRITFDMEIATGNYRFELFDRVPTVPVLPSDRMVMEVKFDEKLPDTVHKLLIGVPAVRCAVSKYAMCREIQ